MNRKPNRLKKYNYSTQGVYFVTICTLERRCILSNIVGGGVLDAPEVRLSEYGKIAEIQIEAMNKMYDDIGIDGYIIMPNHIHLLINIKGSSGTPTPTNAVIPSFVSTFKRFCNKRIGCNIWQRSYNDHIIRDEEDFLHHLKYIDENPAKWSSDKYYLT